MHKHVSSDEKLVTKSVSTAIFGKVRAHMVQSTEGSFHNLATQMLVNELELINKALLDDLLSIHYKTNVEECGCV